MKMKWQHNIFSFLAIFSCLVIRCKIISSIPLVVENGEDDSTAVPTITAERRRKLQQLNVEERFRNVQIPFSDYVLRNNVTIGHNDNASIPVLVVANATNIICTNMHVDRFSVRLKVQLELIFLLESDEENPSPQSRESTLHMLYELDNVSSNISFTEEVTFDDAEEELLASLLRQGGTTTDMMGNIFSCLLSLAYNDSLNAPLNIYVDTGTIVDTLPEQLLHFGATTPSTPSPWSIVNDFLRSNLALPFLASAQIRALLHEVFVAVTSNADCSRQTPTGRLYYVDWRDFFLPPASSLALGGSGTQPYGTTGNVLFTLFNEHILRPMEDNDDDDDAYENNPLVGLNFILAQLMTGKQSKDTGWTMQYPFEFTFDTESQAKSAFFQSVQRSTLRNYELGIKNARIWNIDTLVAPTFLLQPTKEDYALENRLSFGVKNRPLSAAISVSAAFSDMMLSPIHHDLHEDNHMDFQQLQQQRRTIRNDMDLIFTVDSLDVFMELVAKIPLEHLMAFKMNDVGNLYCWLALFSSMPSNSDNDQRRRSRSRSRTDQDTYSMIIKSFMAEIGELKPRFHCPNCSDGLAETLTQFLHSLHDMQVISIWSRRIESLAQELLLNNEVRQLVNDLLIQSCQFCPHRPEFDESMAVSFHLPLDLPPLSSKTVDTFLFTSFGIMEISFLVISEMLYEIIRLRAADAEGDAFAISEPIFSQSSLVFIPEGMDQLDWDGLNGEASLVIEETGNNLHYSRQGINTVLINTILTNFLYLQDGVYNVSLEDRNVKIALAGMETRLHRVCVKGLDSFTNFEVLRTIGPQMFMNIIKMDHLSYSLELSAKHVSNPSPPQKVTVSLRMENINATVPIFFGLDDANDKFRDLRLGSLFHVRGLFQCLQSYAYMLQFPRILVDIGGILPPTVKGLMNDTSDAVAQSIDALFDIIPSKIDSVTHLFFDTILRELLNGLLSSSISQFNCPRPATEDIPQYIDFRQMLKPQELSRSLHPKIGSEESTYGGDMLGVLKHIVDSEIFATDESTGLSKINRILLEPLTATQSGEVGTLYFHGMLLHMKFGVLSPFNLLGLKRSSSTNSVVKDVLEMSLFDLQMENVNSIGAPIELLEPNATAVFGGLDNKTGFGVDNRISIGAGPNPFRIKLKLRLEANATFKMNNMVELEMELDDIAIYTAILAKIRSRELITFPWRYITNVHCWAQLFSTIGGPVAEPGLALTQMDITFSKIRFNMTCLTCSSQFLTELPIVLGKLESVMDVMHGRIAMLVVELLKSYVNDGILGRTLYDTARDCPLTLEGEVPRSEYYDAIPDLPQLSMDSVETIVSALHILFQVAKHFVADIDPNFSLPQLNGETNVDLPPNIQLVDFTTAPEKVYNFIDWANGYLSIPVGSDDKTWDKELLINVLLREILDDTTVTVPINQIVTTDKWSFKLQNVRLSGVDSVTKFHLINVIGPQTVQSQFSWKFIELEVNIVVQSSDVEMEQRSFTATVTIEDADVTTSLLLGLDKTHVSNLELGSILDLVGSLQCLFDVAHTIHVTELNVTNGHMSRLGIEGFQSPDIRAANENLLSVLEDHFGGLWDNSLPFVFDAIVRPIMNNALQYYLLGSGPTCESLVEKREFIDFRDLFFTDADLSKPYGENGQAPYGFWFSTIHSMIDLAMKLNNGNSIRDNAVLVNAIFGSQNNTALPRHFRFPMEHRIKRNIAMLGLNGQFELNISDLVIQNIDTIGSQSSLLQVTYNEPYLLNNTLSVGVGDSERPFRLGCRLGLFLEWSDNSLINDFDIRVGLHSISIVLDFFAKILEQNLLKFPLRNFANINCWLAILTTPEIYSPNNLPDGHFEPSVAIKRLLMWVNDIDVNVTCHNCTTSIMKNPTNLSVEQTEIVNSLLESIIPTIGQPFAQYVINTTLTDAAKICYSSPTEMETASWSSKLLNNISKSPQTWLRQSQTTQLYFFVLSTFLLACSAAGIAIYIRLNVRKHHREYVLKLPLENLYLFYDQQRKRMGLEREVNNTVPCMLHSVEIPVFVKLLMIALIVGNIVLFICGHVGAAGVVTLDINVMDQSIEVYKFSIARFIMDLMNAKEKTITALSTICFVLFVIWPYVRQIVIVTLWVLPPRYLSVSFRDSFFSWLNVLAKWSATDLIIIVITFLAGRISLRSPIGGLEENMLSINMKLVLLWGIYANMVAQLVFLISLQITIYYHKKMIDQARKVCCEQIPRTPPCRSATSSESLNYNGKDEEQELSVCFGKEKREDGEHVVDLKFFGKEKLCKYAFVRPHESRYGRFVIASPIDRILIFGVLLLVVLVTLACLLPVVSFETIGLVGFVQDFGMNSNDEVDKYSVVDVVHMIGNFQAYFAASLLLSTILAVPILQGLALLYLWFSPMTREKRVFLLNFIEMIGAWELSEIFLIAIIAVTWQLNTILNVALDELCGDIDKLLVLLAQYGFPKEYAQCFGRSVTIQAGSYIMFVSILLLYLLKTFVTKAAKQYVWERDEENLTQVHVRNCDVETAEDVKISSFPILFADSYRWALTTRPASSCTLEPSCTL